jgi:hypothetical protein
MVLFVILLAVMHPVTPCAAQTPCPCVEVAPPGPLAALRMRIQAFFCRSRGDCCDGDKLPPAPRKPYCCTEDEDGGMLLKTGAFLLGPGVGRDLLNSQSDGKAGFGY